MNLSWQYSIYLISSTSTILAVEPLLVSYSYVSKRISHRLSAYFLYSPSSCLSSWRSSCLLYASRLSSYTSYCKAVISVSNALWSWLLLVNEDLLIRSYNSSNLPVKICSLLDSYFWYIAHITSRFSSLAVMTGMDKSSIL